MDIHFGVMAKREKEGFVLRDGLRIVEVGNGDIVMAGDIDCDGGIVIQVYKEICLVDGDARDETRLVKTSKYNYAAKVSGRGVVVRYCSPHSEQFKADHDRHHHCHHHDDDFQETHVSTFDDPDRRPTLGDVINEARAWLENHPTLAGDVHTHRD